MKFCKNIVLSMLVISVGYLFSGCVNNNSDVLHIYNWGDFIHPDVLDMFEEETGIRVNQTTFDANETMYTRIVNGGSQYDVIFPSDYMIYRMINEDLLQPLNFENIPNISNIDEQFRNLEFDPNNEYSVPYMWGTVGILYNTTMVTEPVTSWNILWNPDYAGQIFMYASERDSLGIALKTLGYSLNTVNEDEIIEARDLLIQQKPLVQAYVTDNVRNFMIGNDGALAVVYSGDALYSIINNPDLNYVLPTEGSNLWVDSMVIPRTSTKVEEAEMFINFMLRPDIAALNTNYIGYSTPNIAAIEQNLIDEELINHPSFTVTDEEYDRLEVFLDLGEHRELYTRAWTTVLGS